MSNRGILAVIAAIAFIALLAFGLVAKNGAQIAVGEPAPDGAVETQDGTGEASLADHRGKWVLLNFWASWCEPCRTEAPAIQKFADQNPDVVVIGMDTEDLSGDAQDFVREFDLTYEMLHDGDGERKDAYGIFALPETFLIDPNGDLALIQRGPVDEKFLNEQVKPLIDGGTAPE
jgi:cytochrome c biogenesis protein CcmG/thiol:disulfide interchange protein DsbE